MHPDNVNFISWRQGLCTVKNCFKRKKYKLIVEIFNVKVKIKNVYEKVVYVPQFLTMKDCRLIKILPETKSNLESREIAAIES